MANLHSSSKKAINDIQKLIEPSSRVVFVSGNFNIVHPGHLRMLRHAAECGDFLVVGVNSDELEETLLDENLRLESVQATNWVDYAFILRDLPEDFIKIQKPYSVVKGQEHESSENREKKVLDSYGGKLLFSSGDISFSSLELLKKEFNSEKISLYSLPEDFIKRRAIKPKILKTSIEKLKGLKVLVIGDLIVDEYITCEALGMSQEDPTIVVSPVLSERFIGGAGIVSSHASSLGAEVSFFSICGNDEVSEFSKQGLEDIGIKSVIFTDETRPTTLKQRFRADTKTLLRVNHLKQNPINKEIQIELLNRVREELDSVDIVVFSDFNYGCLPGYLVQQISKTCIDKNIMMVADSQSSSQIGDISRFENMTLLTPTEREARLAMQNYTDGLVVLAENLRKKALANNVLMTLGSEGVLIHANNDSKSGFDTDRIPALNSSPKDVSGAGDSLFICASLALSVGTDIWHSALLGSMASACQVGKLGNIPIKLDELLQEISLLDNITL